MRQPEAVGGRILRPRSEDGFNDADLSLGGASGGVARQAPETVGMANRRVMRFGSASRIVIGRSAVAGLYLAPRPTRAPTMLIATL